MKYEATVLGLTITKIGSSYQVRHASSSNAATPPLRQRRFAEEARDELIPRDGGEAISRVLNSMKRR